jgi:hypothetical protein
VNLEGTSMYLKVPLWMCFMCVLSAYENMFYMLLWMYFRSIAEQTVNYIS